MKRIVALIAILCVSMIAQAQSAQVTKAKALLTLNFIRYIGWTDEARQGDFVIGVLKDKDMANQLRTQSAGKKFGFQDVVVKEYKNVEELEDCQVVYCSSSISFSRSSQAIMNKVGKGTLLISEQEGATNSGSMINFVIRDDKLKFELSKKNASYAGIQFSTKLEQMTAAINL